MRPERFVISDRSWAIIEPLVPGITNSCGLPQKTCVCFWKPFCGRCAWVVRGATFRPVLAFGTASSEVFAAGLISVFLIVFSMLYQESRILNIS